MEIRVEDYAPRFRDTEVERELASQLRAIPEAKRLDFINDMMDCGLPHCFVVALWLARTCLKQRKSLEAVLNQGLERGDASTVKYWIEAVIHGLGFRRVVRLLLERLAVDPESVIRAHYHLRGWIPRNNPRAIESFASLDHAVEQIIHDDPSILKRAKPFLESSSQLDDESD